jgi:hypothetical protein
MVGLRAVQMASHMSVFFLPRISTARVLWLLNGVGQLLTASFRMVVSSPLVRVDEFLIV